MFTLSEDERAIVATARDFADEHLAPNALDWDQRKHFPVDVLRSAGTLGMGGIAVADDVGGSGLRRLDAVRIFEQLATGCPAVAAYISIHNMVAWLIDKYGNDEQRKQHLPQLCTMERLGSYGLTEPSAGSDAAALRAKAVRDGDDYVLNGVKQFILRYPRIRHHHRRSRGCHRIVAPAIAHRCRSAVQRRDPER